MPKIPIDHIDTGLVAPQQQPGELKMDRPACACGLQHAEDPGWPYCPRCEKHHKIEGMLFDGHSRYTLGRPPIANDTLAVATGNARSLTELQDGQPDRRLTRAARRHS